MGLPVFKEYAQNQAMLLPPSFDDLIDCNHPVRIVNSVVEQIDLRLFFKKYKLLGTSSYHPRMMLKVVIYGYLTNIYSSRKMETALKENINFMWLSGMQRPDHNTLNRFRSEKLKTSLKEIFSQVVQLLVKEGFISIEEVFVDGTKIESVANRYTFVWKKSIETRREKIQQQIDELWKYAKSVAQNELSGEDDEPPTFKKIDSATVVETVEKIEQALKDQEVPKKIQKKLSYGKKNWPAKLDQYEEQEQILGERNSYAKTDTDATFMRMKEDHMLNGQLKPAYNVQVSSNNQFILDYSIHQTTTDTTTLISHLEQHKALYGQLPKEVVADAGYGSEQNYQYMEHNKIEAYVKHNYFDMEQSSNYLVKKTFVPARLHYNTDKDCYYCPMGQPMHNIGHFKKVTTAGYEQNVTKYKAQNCQGCPINGACHKSKGERIIEKNANLDRLKAIANDRLKSTKGIEHRKKRPWDVESVFGNIKSNHGFRRFMLKGKEKVAIEVGLLALAQNLRKKAA